MNSGSKVRLLKEDFFGGIFYPVPGTVGIVDRIDADGDIWVRWPSGSTSAHIPTACAPHWVEAMT